MLRQVGGLGQQPAAGLVRRRVGGAGSGRPLRLVDPLPHRGEPVLAHLVQRQQLRVAAEQDVDAPTGHVGGDRHRLEPAGLGDDLGLSRVLLGVEHLVAHASLPQQLGQHLGVLDRGRAGEHRLAHLVAGLDVGDDRVELGHLRLVDEVVVVLADHRPVGRDRHDLQGVRAGQLGRLGLRRAGHACELLVHAEVVLQRDRGERLVLFLDRDVLLGLDGLVDALRPAPALERAAGELVDDLHLAPLDDVVLVPVEQLLGLQGHVELVDEVGLHDVVEVLDAELGLDLLDAGVGDRDLPLLLVDLVVDVTPELAHDEGELLVEHLGVGHPPGDDQRRPGLVDEDRVDLVDDRVDVAPLHLVLAGHRHVVAQVVEAELVVRAVGDVGGVLPPLVGGVVHAGHDEADGEPQPVVDLPHPLGVAPGQVLVDRHDVQPAAATGRSGRRAASRRASCPRRSSSRPPSRSAAPRRPSAARRSGAGR